MVDDDVVDDDVVDDDVVDDDVVDDDVVDDDVVDDDVVDDDVVDDDVLDDDVVDDDVVDDDVVDDDVVDDDVVDDDTTVSCWDEEAACDEIVSGDTTSSTNQLDGYNCQPTWNESGPEFVYRLTLVEEVEILTITLTDSNFNADLFLLTDCWDAATCLSGANENLVVNDLEAGVYYLVVDGFNGASGTFEIDISCDYPNPVIIETLMEGLDYFTYDAAMDSGGFIHYTYENDDTIYYVTNATGDWVSETAATSTFDIDYPYIVLYESAAGDVLVTHIMYHNVDTGKLNHADNTGGSWTSEELNTICTGTHFADVDGDGNLHIAYKHPTAELADYSLNYGTNNGGWSFTDLLPLDLNSTLNGIAVQGSPDSESVFVYIPYQLHVTASEYHLLFLTNESGTWETENVQTSPATTHGIGLDIAFDLHGNVHLASSSDGLGLFHHMREAGVWTSTPLSGVVYNYASYINLALDDLEKIHLVYQDFHDYKYGTDMDGAWRTGTIFTDVVFRTRFMGLYDGLIHSLSQEVVEPGPTYDLEYVTFPMGYEGIGDDDTTD